MIIAKFVVLTDFSGVEGLSDTQFTLRFAGAEDRAFCTIRSQRDTKTVMLTVAGTFEGPVVFQDHAQGHVINTTTARLLCNNTALPFEVSAFTLTAIEVDSIREIA